MTADDGDGADDGEATDVPSPGGNPGSATDALADRIEPTRSFVGDGLLLGVTVAVVGLVFLVVYGLFELVFGTFFGANPRVGLSFSLVVLLLGVTLVVVFWVIGQLFDVN